MIKREIPPSLLYADAFATLEEWEREDIKHALKSLTSLELGASFDDLCGMTALLTRLIRWTPFGRVARDVDFTAARLSPSETRAFSWTRRDVFRFAFDYVTDGFIVGPLLRTACKSRLERASLEPLEVVSARPTSGLFELYPHLTELTRSVIVRSSSNRPVKGISPESRALETRWNLWKRAIMTLAMMLTMYDNYSSTMGVDHARYELNRLKMALVRSKFFKDFGSALAASASIEGPVDLVLNF